MIIEILPIARRLKPTLRYRFENDSYLSFSIFHHLGGNAYGIVNCRKPKESEASAPQDGDITGLKSLLRIDSSSRSISTDMERIRISPQDDGEVIYDILCL